jgi:hypothetical protein
VSKKLTCILALLGCLAAPAANAQSTACNVAGASVSVWNFLNETVGLVFDDKIVKVFTAFSKILRFEAENKLEPACQTAPSKAEILAFTKDQATDIYNANVNAKVIQRFDAIKNTTSIENSDYLISDNIQALAGLQSEALSIGTSGKGAYSMAVMAKLALLQHRHQLAHSFGDDVASKGIYGKWFSTATDIIVNVEQIVREMNKLQTDYAVQVDRETKVWAAAQWGNYVIRARIYGSVKNGNPKILFEEVTQCNHPSGDSGPRADGVITNGAADYCGTLYKQKMPWLNSMVNDQLTKYKNTLRTEFLANGNFSELRKNVALLKMRTIESLNNRSQLYKSAFYNNVFDIEKRRLIVDGELSTGYSAPALSGIRIKVNDVPISASTCPNGSVRKQARQGVALVAFRANAPTARNYKISLLNGDGALMQSRTVAVDPISKYYSATFIPQPYYLNPGKAPLAEWVLVEALDNTLELDEVYSFSPDAGAGIITSQSTSLMSKLGQESNKAVDGSSASPAFTSHTNFGGTTQNWWRGELAKPTKVNFISIEAGNIFAQDQVYTVLLYGPGGFVIDSFAYTVPAAKMNVKVTYGLCGQIPPNFVTKIEIKGPPGAPVILHEVKVDPIAYASD